MGGSSKPKGPSQAELDAQKQKTEKAEKKLASTKDETKDRERAILANRKKASGASSLMGESALRTTLG